MLIESPKSYTYEADICFSISADERATDTQISLPLLSLYNAIVSLSDKHLAISLLVSTLQVGPLLRA